MDLDKFDINQISTSRIVGYPRVKRAVDLFLVAVSFPLALLILAIAALGIRLTMGSPVLYFQPRVGLGGRVFQMVKLRTMWPDVDGAEYRVTTPDDPRVTPLGRILRPFRIDEIPQLWNVVRGDMSLIGPRPEWTEQAEEFERQEPKYALRNLVRPGITGWAQVHAGPTSDLPGARVKLAYDLFYIKHMSFALDLEILWRTGWTLLASGGAR
ncbi:MAG TPA: sugar transferase [Caulobacteraceae bacterium]